MARAGVSVFLLSCSLLLPSLSTAREETATPREARVSSDRPPSERLAAALDRRIAGLRATSAPEQFEAAADAFGALVAREREIRSPESGLARLIAAAAQLGARIGEAGQRREEMAGEDEAALARLYRSPGWQRLGYAEVTVGYWLGWARLSRAQRLPTGKERHAELERAERAFSRSAVELGLPRIAMLSLLGLGMARRELGDGEHSRLALERFERQLQQEGYPAALAPGLYELAVMALEDGDIEHAHALATHIPDEARNPTQELALAKLEALAWLRRAEAGRPGAQQAAALLRRLSARGGAAAQFATKLILAHREALRDLDVGPAGELVRAETSYAEGHFDDARAAYARTLERAAEVPGADLQVTRYKFAVSLYESGAAAERVLAALEPVVAADGDDAVRHSAARLYYALAARVATEQPSPSTESQALRAAELLLTSAPEAAEADHARYRIARHASFARKAGRKPLDLLEAIRKESEVYPAACLERTRLRASSLEGLEGPGRAARPAQRREAGKLLSELDTLSALIREGRLPPDPRRDAWLSVLRAQATSWSGAEPGALLDRISEALRGPSLGPREHRVLLRLQLFALRRQGRLDGIAALLDSTAEDDVRRDWEVWYEALQRASEQTRPRGSRESLLRLHARLAALAPQNHREEAALSEAQALLAAGRPEAAAAKARRLVDSNPNWGDARLAYAQALESMHDNVGALTAWSELAAGLEPESELWLEAQLGMARAMRQSGNPLGACRKLEEIDHRLDQRHKETMRERLEVERAECTERNPGAF